MPIYACILTRVRFFCSKYRVQICKWKVTGADTGEPENYVGLTANDFKSHYRNHMASFRNNKSRNSTELSKYIWSLKDSNPEFSIV